MVSVNRIIRCSFFFIFFYSSLFPQAVTIDLPSRTTLDDPEFHITLFQSEPNEKLILPHIDITNARYFELFNSRNLKNDDLISCVVFPSDTGDVLYIDLNNDEDMTDDGPPIFFSQSQREIAFTILNTPDPLQTVQLKLRRKPTLPDSSLQRYFDKEGNLNPNFAAFYSAIPGKKETSGKRGTFYVDYAISLQSGSIQINNETFRIGIFDSDNNGIFNDSSDVVIIDLNRDKALRFGDYSEVFLENEVFTIKDTNYKLSRVDRYGSQIELVRTSKRPRHLFLTKQTPFKNESDDTGILDSTFWKERFRSLDGKNILLQQYKGKYLLLNFWGEWCGPCVAEIPILTEAYETEKLEILGLLQPSDLRKAKEMITSKKMSWKQTILSEELKKKFAINSFPTNILILPDGIHYKRSGSIFDKKIFDVNQQ